MIYQDGYRSGLPPLDRRSAEEARRVSEELGVPIVGLAPYTTGINALDEEQWRTAVDEFRGAIGIAQVVGADRLRVYAGSWHPAIRTARRTGTGWLTPYARWHRKHRTPGFACASRTTSGP